MGGLVSKTRKAIVQAVDQLITDFKIYSLDFLPYEAHLVILTYIYANNPTLNAPQMRRVRQWFWRTSFSERYRGAPDTFVTSDLEAIQTFVLEGAEEDADTYGVPPEERVLKSMIFRKNNSRSRAFTLVLAKARLARGISQTETLSILRKRSPFTTRSTSIIYSLKRIYDGSTRRSSAVTRSTFACWLLPRTISLPTRLPTTTCLSESESWAVMLARSS